MVRARRVGHGAVHIQLAAVGQDKVPTHIRPDRHARAVHDADPQRAIGDQKRVGDGQVEPVPRDGHPAIADRQAVRRPLVHVHVQPDIPEQLIRQDRRE